MNGICYYRKQRDFRCGYLLIVCPGTVFFRQWNKTSRMKWMSRQIGTIFGNFFCYRKILHWNENMSMIWKRNEAMRLTNQNRNNFAQKSKLSYIQMKSSVLFFTLKGILFHSYCTFFIRDMLFSPKLMKVLFLCNVLNFNNIIYINKTKNVRIIVT